MGFTSEDRLMILCSRVEVCEDALASASLALQADLDWRYILEASVRHSVAPLFYHGLKQVQTRHPQVAGRIPGAVHEKLADLYRMSQDRSQRMYRVTGEIASSFARAGLQVMALKELHLARDVYPDPGLRPIGDLDLLIHFDDYPQAAICLQDLGFEPLPFADLPYTLKYAWGHHFRRPSDQVWVDLQWNLMQIEWDAYQEGSFDFEIGRMWAGARSVTFDDFQLWVPRLEDMLFHLCLHLEGHRYTELVLFCDIAELIRVHGSQLDWAYFAELARKYRVESAVYYPLWLTQKLFQVDGLDEHLAEIDPPYWTAGLFSALYGNLTRLHLELDEIREAAHPPPEGMQAIESIVRKQAFSAMQVYRELDQLIGAFKTAGGGYILPEGAPSERLYPDQTLPAFNELRLLVLEDDLPKLRGSFIQAGFTQSEHGTFCKALEVTSRDPLLQGKPQRILFSGQVSDFQQEMSLPDDGPSSRQAAVKLLKARLSGQGRADEILRVNLRVLPLAPPQLLACLAERAGSPGPERLRKLVGLSDFLRLNPGLLDDQPDLTLVVQSVNSQHVTTGLSLAAEILGRPALQLAGSPSPQADLPLRLLEWARPGPEVADSFTRFKRPFYFMLCLLALEGMRSKLRYLLGLSSGTNRPRFLLPAVVLDALAGSLGLLRRKRKEVPPLAYWVEADFSVGSVG